MEVSLERSRQDIWTLEFCNGLGTANSSNFGTVLSFLSVSNRILAAINLSIPKLFTDLISLVKGNNAWDFQKISHATQNTLPFRVDRVLLVNAPWWMRTVLAIVKPMLKPKMRRKLQVSDASELHNHFTLEQLATMYGGKFEISSNWVDEIFVKRGGLSDGKYVDTAPRNEALSAQIKGDAYDQQNPSKNIEMDGTDGLLSSSGSDYSEAHVRAGQTGESVETELANQ